ncbi:flagellar basal body rod protein [Oceaniovalibus guishaninsula JLT2003]|uniref:Flagellar basal body rod protein n=1 Tax=Oceaniovalibus guishaninsula JLT2003 TaxID=1231392 RepID=K2I4H1_9RHOB|nr:FlgB family protein [Oceaniovalibus guishaninsula]EKE43780.1 flagellar basal body rod protein [Oceaniovalibus guishaninsula JLT2003]
MAELGLFRMASAMAGHAADRQRHVAANIANADTPGYRATDLPDFATVVNDEAGIGPTRMRATRPGHIADTTTPGLAAPIRRDAQPSPNGNTVSLETEMMQAAGIRQQHDTALSIYSAARDIVRASLGRGR